MIKDVKINIKPTLLKALYGEASVVVAKPSPSAAPVDIDLTSKSIAVDVEANKFKPRKKAISIRMDVDVLNWFKAQPGKYQQLINQACRTYMKNAPQPEAVELEPVCY